MISLEALVACADRNDCRPMFYHAAHEFFDGGWDTASILLLTDLANRMSLIPSEVLILQPQAFSPTSWEYEDQKRLFSEAMDFTPYDTELETQDRQQQANISNAESCGDVLAWLKLRENKHPVFDKWELDFSSTYVLHGVDNWFQKIVGRDFDVRYVLARQSNYARAVFPAVWRAIQEEIISIEEFR